MSVRKSVEEGKTISAPLQETKVYPMMVCQMISVGEQTGALDQMLSKIADFYEDEVDTAVNGLMKLIEPIMIVILGVIIGYDRRRDVSADVLPLLQDRLNARRGWGLLWLPRSRARSTPK